MRIYQLFHAIIEKFVPMDDKSKLELQNGAVTSYDKIKVESENIKEQIVKAQEYNEKNKKKIEAGEMEKMPSPQLKLKHKAIDLLEQWWIRYIIATAFIFIVPYVKNWINGEMHRMEDGPGEGADDFQAFLEFRRYQKGMM